MNGYTFGIITNGKRAEKLSNEVGSILRLNIPKFEILVCGIMPSLCLMPSVQFIEAREAAAEGRLGYLRNQLAKFANYDHLIIADDDMLFAPDFYQGLLKFGEDYEVQCCRLLNPDGTRNWDWVTKGGKRGHCLIEYWEDDPYIYVSGGRIIMKRFVFDKVQWNDQLGFNQEEDIDFSQRLHEAGISIKMNPYAVMIHDDPSYTSKLHTVYKVI